MKHSLLKVRDVSDSADEATLMKFHEGSELPDGQWLVKQPSGFTQVTEESEMPEHWQQQIQKAVEFGKRI